jgi:chlorite dismutase
VSEAVSTPQLNHFGLFAFRPEYWALAAQEQAEFHRSWLADLRSTAPVCHLYQVFPAQAHVDLLVWSALPVGDPAAAAGFFEAYACSLTPWRQWLEPEATLWGFTGSSSYSKARSAQAMDAFDPQRRRYLVLYPFVKTDGWYQLGEDSRQGMMNEHMRLGKRFPEISQLLLYSFGLQDQEFVVVYETDDLRQFSELVRQLRSTDGRPYTQRDTPLYSALYHPAEETLALWRRG